MTPQEFMDGYDLALRCDESRDEETKELLKTWLFQNSEHRLVPHLFSRLVETEGDKAELHKWIDKWLRPKKRRTDWSLVAVAEQFPTPKYLDYARDDFKHGLGLPWSNRLLIKLLRENSDEATIEAAEHWIARNGFLAEGKTICELLKKHGSQTVSESNLAVIGEEKIPLLQSVLQASPSAELISSSMNYLQHCQRTAKNALFLEFLIREELLDEPEHLVEAWMKDWPSRVGNRRESLVFIACNYIRNYPDTEYSQILQDRIMTFIERWKDWSSLFLLAAEGILTPRTIETIKAYLRSQTPEHQRRFLFRLFESVELDAFQFDQELHEIAEEYLENAENPYPFLVVMAKAFPARYLSKLDALPMEKLGSQALLLLPEKWNEEVASSIESDLLHRTRYHPWYRIDRGVSNELDMVEALLNQERPSQRSLQLARNCLHDFLPAYEEFLSPNEAKRIASKRPRIEKLLQYKYGRDEET